MQNNYMAIDGNYIALIINIGLLPIPVYTFFFNCSLVGTDVTRHMTQFDVQFLILYSGLQSIKQVIF